MSNLLNAMKEKFNHLKQNVMLRTVLISVLALLLIFSVTLAWYINNLGLWGMEFNTGNIDFNIYIYSEDGKKLAGPISPDDEDLSKYLNAPLATINDAQVGSIGTAYIAVESTGSIGIEYRLAFDVTGKTDKALAYLGGYKYNISKVTEKVVFNANSNLDVFNCPRPENISDEIVTIDRNAVNGMIEQKQGYEVYRFDYSLVNKNEEYTGNGIKIYLNVFATQIGGDFEDTEERGNTYYCSTTEDIDRAKVEAYPGDTIKLSSDIVYYGDLVFNKPINLETNDFTLTVNGNLMYDYVLGNSLKLDAGGLGQIVVQCTKEGVGGNLKIKAPLSDVTLTGSNASVGDLIVEKTITIDASNAFGSPGVSFNTIRIVDLKNSRKTILLESNTRATVSFGTTIGLIQSVVKANNIEIINNGVIGDINLSNMALLDQTNSPQIYILNNNDINNPISLPAWSVKFVKDAGGNCTGNTRIIQSYSGSQMTVVGSCPFTNTDIEVEMKDALVEQIEEGNDSRLKIYYQDVDGTVTSIQSILENYLQNEATTSCTMNEIMQLEIISVGTKAVTTEDIIFMNSNSMLSLKHLDMQRANIYDSVNGIANRLPDRAFNSVNKYDTLVLPQNLAEIGNYALESTDITNYVTIPSSVTTFGTHWFRNSKYVGFAASVPDANAVNGLTNVKAIFVDEPYIASYKSVYSSLATRIYPNSVLDETEEHFVRNTAKGEWEITYYISGDDAIIGDDISINGELLNITSVYDNAYRHNYTVSDIHFDDTVENVGAGNFYGNGNVSKVDLNKVKTLGSDVFTYCSNLTKVDFGEKLETIGNFAFYYCSNMKQEVELPMTMKKIGISAFQGSPITMVNTGGTESIDGRAFNNCQYLVAVEMPKAVTFAENGTNEIFAFCTNLVSVNMPSAVYVNGSKMFESCKSLRELTLGTVHDSLSLGSATFLTCDTSKIKLFVPEEDIAFFQERRPGGFAAHMIYPIGEKMGEELVNGFNIGQYIVKDNGDGSATLITSNLNHSGAYSIPTKYDGTPITKIYANCFRNQKFTDVKLTLGNNLRDIGDNAFYGLSGLVKVEFGNKLENLGNYTFASCANFVQDVVLPSSMKTIGNYTFSSTGILNVDTGGTKTIGGGVFSWASSLVYANMPEVTVVAEGGKNEVFASCTSLVSVHMPKVTTVSGTHMFSYCSSLVELYMGAKDNNVSVGGNAFANVGSDKVKLFVPLDALTLYSGRGIVNEKQVYPIGEKVGDKAINGFVIGDYIVLENDDGYSLVTSNLSYNGNCTILEEYNGKPITEIFANAFRNQTFTDVNLTLSDHVTTIGARAFHGLSGLKAVKMDSVHTVNAEAFYSSGIQVLNGPQLKSIGSGAFRYCHSLELVTLPKLVELQEGQAFANCSKLKSVYFEDVMSLAGTTFTASFSLEKVTINRLINSEGTNMPSAMKIEKTAPCKIYVPYRSLSAYGTTWSDKPVVSFDLTAVHNGDTYVLSETNAGRYILIDFLPSKSSTSLTLPASVAVDGAYIAIYGIQSGAFSTVASTLKAITLSSSVAMLGNGAFAECSLLENIYVVSDNRYFTAISGVLYSKDSKMLVKYPTGRSGKFDMTAAAYASTVGIGASAFENVIGLTQIVFPASLQVIDGTAFKNCTKLHTVEFKGTTPPVLMGSGIFDTDVESFKMVIPTTSSSVVTAYLCAYNFGEYEPYIDLAGNAAPSTSTDRNKVTIG